MTRELLARLYNTAQIWRGLMVTGLDRICMLGKEEPAIAKRVDGDAFPKDCSYQATVSDQPSACSLAVHILKRTLAGVSVTCISAIESGTLWVRLQNEPQANTD